MVSILCKRKSPWRFVLCGVHRKIHMDNFLWVPGPGHFSAQGLGPRIQGQTGRERLILL